MSDPDSDVLGLELQVSLFPVELRTVLDALSVVY